MGDGATSVSWVPLLQDLAGTDADMAVYKNAERALVGDGDVDFLAPRARWPEIEEAFARWGGIHGLDVMPACRHRPYAMYLVAADHDGGLLQLDVRDRVHFRRATLVTAEDAAPMYESHALGFRALRPGAEGVLKLFLRGMGPRGELLEESAAKYSIRELVRDDPEGAESMAACFLPAPDDALAVVRSLADGRWDSARARSMSRSFAMASLRDPVTLTRLAMFRRARRTCPLLRWVLRNGQARPPRLEDWMGEVREAHAGEAS